ncbi:MAG: mechanosensitive ion channel, partial [Spirochaetia bacterium]|nr:mechanosensitive ion channel [Spirochaetia bacterium]
DLKSAMQELLKVPEKCPTVLKDPEPKVWFENLGESGIDMILAVWFAPSDLIQTKNDVFMNIVEVFKNANIEIPYNKIDVKLLDAGK